VALPSSGGPTFLRREARPELTAQGRDAPMLQLAADAQKSAARWKALPPLPKVVPLDSGFTDYCRFVYRLLMAWEDVAGKPAGFADDIFAVWDRQQHSTDNAEDSAGSYPRWLDLVLRWADDRYQDAVYGTITKVEEYRFGNHVGTLYMAEGKHWLTALKDLAAGEHDSTLPARPEGLRHRLMELTPDNHGFKLLTDKEEPALLKRTGQRRLWGILKVS
jgi:hypothetical protein